MLLELLGVVSLSFGLFFCAVGVIGVIRLPDTLSRLHASGKVAILGLFGILLGAALLMPSTALRLLTLGLFILLTSPVATHAIAASVHRREEIAKGVVEKDGPEAPIEVTNVNVTAVISRSQIQDILEAQDRAMRQHSRGGAEDNT